MFFYFYFVTDNIQIIENNDLNTLNKEILKFTILVTHFETQPALNNVLAVKWLTRNIQTAIS